MATATIEPQAARAAPPRAPVVFEDRVVVPAWVHDLWSDVFERWFKLTEEADRLGNPRYRLLVRAQ
jgi:hypothetical protein